MDPGPAICEQTGHPKKQQKTSRQKVINFTEMVANWGPQGRPKFGHFATFSQLFAPRARNVPGVVPGSRKVRPRRPKGVKRYQKVMQKTSKRGSTRRQNALSRCLRPSRHRAMIGDCISHCIGCCIGDCIGHCIAY